MTSLDRMCREFVALSRGGKAIAVGLFVVGFLYPLAGFVIAGAARALRLDRSYSRLALAGSIVSLALFVVEYVATAVAWG